MSENPESDGTSNSERIEIYPSRRQLLLIMLGGGAFTLVAAYLAMFDSNSFQRFIGFVLFIAFSTILIQAADRLVTHRPTLVIDRRGLTMNLSFLPLGYLEWSEIGSFRTHGSFGTLYLTVHPKDMRQTLSRAGGLGAFLAVINTLDSSTPFKIPERLVEMPLDELASLLEARLRSSRQARREDV